MVWSHKFAKQELKLKGQVKSLRERHYRHYYENGEFVKKRLVPNAYNRDVIFNEFGSALFYEGSIRTKKSAPTGTYCYYDDCNNLIHKIHLDKSILGQIHILHYGYEYDQNNKPIRAKKIQFDYKDKIGTVSFVDGQGILRDKNNAPIILDELLMIRKEECIINRDFETEELFECLECPNPNIVDDGFDDISDEEFYADKEVGYKNVKVDNEVIEYYRDDIDEEWEECHRAILDEKGRIIISYESRVDGVYTMKRNYYYDEFDNEIKWESFYRIDDTSDYELIETNYTQEKYDENDNMIERCHFTERDGLITEMYQVIYEIEYF